MADCYKHFSDPFDTAKVVNDIKKVGFGHSTRGGMSIAVDDACDAVAKQAGDGCRGGEAADKVDRQYKRGLMTEDERLREIEAIWNKCRDDLQRDIEERLKGQNSVYMMADWREGKHEPDQPDGWYARSGARSTRQDRGNSHQVEFP
ncbi:MAG: hypothetical protein R2848_17370 [Thermomicrobiales bacterium]